MKVHELIEILDELDPDASVYVMSQQSWPFEVAIHGVAVREDFAEADPDGDEPDAEAHDRWGASEGALPPSDVFIVEGSQLRYGNKGAWDAARRR
ncbi:MAG: hypothetical protein ABIE42_10125 [Candidatus Eisenbacteria bacterium]